MKILNSKGKELQCCDNCDSLGNKCRTNVAVRDIMRLAERKKFIDCTAFRSKSEVEKIELEYVKE